MFVSRCVRQIAKSLVHHAPRKGDKVVVGMSGGVDSSVTALLLSKRDYDLSAVYMRNWDTRDESGTDKGCEWEKDWEDVQTVCKTLDIPCSLIDLSKEYWNRVFEPSLRGWEYGMSPNPDVWCNREIKFGALLDRLSLETRDGHNSWFATGHYARKAWADFEGEARPVLLRPKDHAKDQTYFLSAVPERGLSKALFPLEQLTKPEVRELAKQAGLSIAERPDSVGICFVGEKSKFSKFLASYIPPNPGPIIHRLTGEIVGEHPGLWAYTVGQNARIPGMPEKLFVSSKDPETNAIYVVPGSKHSSLFASTIHVPDFSWIWRDAPPLDLDPGPVHLQVMHRYRMQPVNCTVVRDGSGVIIRCNQPTHAVTAGQIAVLYDRDRCLGSGVISSAS